MTSIDVANRTGPHNRSTEAQDWKRHAERLVRRSGRPYTILRPGWFDHNAPDEQRLVLLQGDTRQAGDPSDGTVARQQIAEVLVRSLTSEQGLWKTFELVAVRGQASTGIDALFAELTEDAPGELDGVFDAPKQPLEDEPRQVRSDLDAIIVDRATARSIAIEAGKDQP